MHAEDVSEIVSAVESDSKGGAEERSGRRPFVEPEVSFPVDVLESTTFFQISDSGVIPQ